MQTVGSVRIKKVDIIFPLALFLLVESFKLRKLGCNIRQDPEIAIASGGEKVAAFIRQIDLMVLLFDNEEEFVVDEMHIARLIAEIFHLRRLHQLGILAIGDKLKKSLIL